MRTTDTYENEIKQKYLNDKEQGLLRGNLHNLTPSSIRTVCLNICDETKIEADVLIMRNFFSDGKGETLRQKINTYDLDSFKPIRNFLKGNTSSIKSHNTIELTALIVDFRPRPYNKYRKSNSTKKNEEITPPKGAHEYNSEKKEKDTIIVVPIPSPTNNSNNTNNTNNSNNSNSKSVNEVNTEFTNTLNKKETVEIINGGEKSYKSHTGFTNTDTNTINSASGSNTGDLNTGSPSVSKYNTARYNVSTKTIVISFIILISAIIIIPLNKTRWMVWQNGEYVETNFDTNKYGFNQLKFYKKDRLLNFKLIKNPNCNTTFFKPNGKPNVWYGRNAKGELELFTSYGLHPETGKTLKPITAYMINTYLCP